MEEQAKIYLNQYLESLSDSERVKYQSFSADYFCADEHNANLCAELIRIGQKKQRPVALNIGMNQMMNQCLQLGTYRLLLIGMVSQFVSLKLTQLKSVSIPMLQRNLRIWKVKAIVHLNGGEKLTGISLPKNV